MIPAWWTGIVLALGTFRVVRLIGWDDLPPLARLRAWATGETARRVGSPATLDGMTSERPQLVYSYRRPVLAHFLACPFCLGFWLSGAVYAAWLLEPAWTLYGAAPCALSAAVGLIAKNLDP